MKGKVTTQDWSMNVSRSWESQINTCGSFAIDDTLHPTCSHSGNCGNLSANGVKRCNIFNCPKAEEVYQRAKGVNVSAEVIKKLVHTPDDNSRVINQCI